jgi:hypothetical protein
MTTGKRPPADAWVAAAAQEWRERARGLSSPEGTGTYEHYRWYPSEREWQPCCAGISVPVAPWKFPWSLYRHCRTITHVAQLYGVDERELRREIRRLTQKGGVAP